MKFIVYVMMITLSGGYLAFSQEQKPERVSYVGKPAPSHVPDYIFVMRKRPGDGHWYANFGHYAAGTEHKAYSAGDSALCRYNAKTGKISVLMEDKEGCFRDPVVHWDGKKILFSYRKGGTENYNLYEIGVDGKNLKQITNDAFDDIEACYLPDDRIMFVSSRCKRWVNCWLTQVAIIYRCDADGVIWNRFQQILSKIIRLLSCLTGRFSILVGSILTVVRWTFITYG